MRLMNRIKKKNSENLKRAVLGDIHHRVKVLKVKEIDNHLPKIGRTKNDSTSMFQVNQTYKATKTKIPSPYRNRYKMITE